MKGMIRHMNPEKPSEAKIEVDSEELRKIQKQKEEWDNMMNYSGMR